MADPWDGYVPAETLAHYERVEFARRRGIGRNPALLVIDVQYHTSGEGPMPLAEAVAYHTMNCGEHAWRAIPRIARLLEAFRAADLPVIYPYVQRRWTPEPVIERHWQIVEEVAPVDGELLLPKIASSAFFGTPLMQILVSNRIDTLFLVGNTTSGCIRATAVDAASYDLHVVTVHDGCYDRSDISHAINLFDMSRKYSDIVTTDQAIDSLEKFRTDRAT